MVSKYEISSVQPYTEGTRMKNVLLRSGGKKVDNISKSVERTTDLKTLERVDDVINECYIDLTLEKLREIDGDREAQERYIKSRAKFLERGYINIFIVKLHTGQKLEELDYEYLNSLLGWTMNDIYVMPTLEFDAAKVPGNERYEIYDEFVKKMLDMKERIVKYPDLNVGVMIPSFYSRRRIHNLFELYDDVDHTFVAFDFSNRRIDDTRPGEVVSTVIKYFDDKEEEKTFFYGVNVKPWKRASSLSTPALDMHSIHMSFNAIGPPHSKPRAVILPNEWNAMGKVFQSDDYSYYRMGDEGAKSTYIEWMDKNYDIEISPIFEENVGKPSYSYIKRMNFENANVELAALSDAIKKNDGDVLKNVIECMPEGIKKI